MVAGFSWLACGQDLVLLWSQGRQFLDKRHHCPDTLIIMGWTPGGHTTGLDPVFDDPELALRAGGVAGIMGVLISLRFTPGFKWHWAHMSL